MIFTDRFVYVHEPKTGGTFVTAALLRLHGIRWHPWTHLVNTIKHELVYETRYGRFVYQNNKHGTCREIPAAERGKPVLATIRNPYDLLVSQYEFGWWRRRGFLKYYRQVPEFKSRFKEFPDLTFAQFVKLMNEAFGESNEGHGEKLGWCTTQFVKYYFERPDEILEKFNDEYVASKNYQGDMFDVHFISTDKLNRGLHDFLARAGYREEELGFILELERVLPGGKGRRAEQRWEKYYTPELKNTVRMQERYLFEMFPQFDV